MEEKNIIKAITDEIANELYQKEDQYIISRLYFKCEFCTEITPIKEGVINYQNQDFVSVSKDYSATIKRNIILSCKKCSENIYMGV